jgi:hypothetical protein
VMCRTLPRNGDARTVRVPTWSRSIETTTTTTAIARGIDARVVYTCGTAPNLTLDAFSDLTIPCYPRLLPAATPFSDSNSTNNFEPSASASRALLLLPGAR